MSSVYTRTLSTFETRIPESDLLPIFSTFIEVINKLIRAFEQYIHEPVSY